MTRARAASVGRRRRILAAVATSAAMVVMLLGTAGFAAGAAGPREAAAPYSGEDRNGGLVILAQSRSEPAIILGPLPDETAPEALTDRDAQSTVAEEAEREPPPIPRKKPERKTVSAPKPAQKTPAQKAPAQKAPAQKAPAQKAPAKAAISPPPQAKDCDYCYGCWSSTHACRRQWVCGKRYSELLAAGLCRR